MSVVKMCALCHKPRSLLGSKITMHKGYRVWMCAMCAKEKNEKSSKN